MEHASSLQLWGAFGLGLLIGWYVYFLNRYRKGDVQLSDIVTLLGAIGGTAVLALFPAKTDLFGAYGIGLATGFFGYFLVLAFLVARSVGKQGAFDVEWFLDGRRRNPPDGWGYGLDSQGPVRPMAFNPQPPPAAPVLHYHGANPGEAAALMNAIAPMAFAAPNPDAQQVAAVCRAVWSASGPQGPLRFACNFFAIEVAHRLGVVLSGRADQIVDTLRAAPWTLLADGIAARDAAAQGKLVLVALKSGDFSPPQTQGHVAVVVPGPLNPGGWAPAGYWGSTDPSVRDLGGSGLPISRCFTAGVRDKLVYASHDL